MSNRWLAALARKAVWRRACKLGVPVGILQAFINQGDYWLLNRSHEASMTKTIISFLVTFVAALGSSAEVHLDQRDQINGN